MTRQLMIVLIISAIVFSSCADSRDDATEKVSEPSSIPKIVTETSETLVSNLIQAEDLVLDLTFRLKSIGQFWQNRSNLKSTDGNGPDVLSNELKTIQRSRELIAFDPSSEKIVAKNVCDLAQIFEWPIESKLHDASEGSDPLRSLLEALSDVRDIKFGVLRGDYVSGHESFVTEILITGKGTLKEDHASFNSHHELIWKPIDQHWILVQWQVLDMTVTSSSGTAFQDVLDKAIPDELTRQKLRRSYHEELIEATVNTGQTPIFDPRYKPFVGAASPHSLPSASVVDYNSDGWDDLFVSARWGPTQLLKNNGDGTFEDVTHEAGLEFPGLVNCSVFVDLDNDGDKDVVIGRSLEPVVYMRNDSGKFTDVTRSNSDLSSQYMVSAISVADVNRDGLLDLYLSTYGPSGINERIIHDRGDGGSRFLTFKQRQTLTRFDSQEVNFVDHAGPPNVMVINRGDGNLERIRGNELIAQWHHSYQSAWADVDNDGDDDLYLANDFAQDAFLLNETPQGAAEPVFRDGLDSAFPDGGTGFGMGASWGDFDSDGDLDLYVSNMYSKAGTRILRTIGEGDPRFEIATRGNFLYENQDGKFVNRAGTKPGQLNVGKVGWSYGGQFVDFDNNGHLDLYVPSGYFTAIASADTKVDI